MVNTRRMQASLNREDNKDESMSAVLCRLATVITEECLPVGNYTWQLNFDSMMALY